MKLLKLSANKDSFRTVLFNESGISLITSIKKSESKKETYNSTGKSLTIALVHFCLGSNKIDEFEKKLGGWKFTLDFKVVGATYSACRSTDEQGFILLNGEKLSLVKFRAKLGELVFCFDKKIKFLTFRSLISRFIRPKRGSYLSYDTYVLQEKKKEFPQQINNSYLLGLDVNKVCKKIELKDLYDKTEKLKKNIESDEILKNYFRSDGDENIDIEIVELESKINLLQGNLNNFKIAEDYYDIKKNADEISKELNTLKNKATKLRNAIENINKSLKIKPDIKAKDIEKIYNDSQIFFGAKISKRLEELEAFNKTLIGNRSSRLAQEKERFESDLITVDHKIINLGQKENEKLQYLNAHGALGEYTQLNKNLSDLEKKLDKLTKYKNLNNHYKTELQNIQKDFQAENILAEQYIQSIDEDIIKKNIRIFKSFAEKFYGDKAAGISIKNNVNKNKIRFEISAKIQNDTGDAVGEVKLFCFDWTLLKAQHNHKIKFIFHDSRITDGMDTRQIATMFRIAFEECDNNDFQYIISLNQNVIDNLKSEFSEQEFKKFIEDSEILQLNDENDSAKLLGIQVDLNYDAKDDDEADDSRALEEVID